MIEIIEKIEGEAKLDFSFSKGVIEHTDIVFTSSRGIEQILQNRPAQDALVINPRVCGICNHAHLIATVRAIEDCFEEIEVSQKAQTLREVTLHFEIILNHFKWLYLVLPPLFGQKQNIKASVAISSLVAKAIAVIAGQYPHNSYAVLGGISSALTQGAIVELQALVDAMIEHYKTLVDTKRKNFWECDSIERVLGAKGEFVGFAQTMIAQNLHEIGKSYDRFLVFGQSSYFKTGKSHKTKVLKNLNHNFIEEGVQKRSLAKNVTYKGRYYEVGALSRAMLLKTPLIKDTHRKFGDSVFSRITARVCEIAQLLHVNKQMLLHLNLSQPSYVKPALALKKLCGEGIGSVEAARGSLIHKVKVDEGIIKEYQIVTPTQWNLSNGTKKNPATAQKAMQGLRDKKTASIVFKSFDVCSVCTTH